MKANHSRPPLPGTERPGSPTVGTDTLSMQPNAASGDSSGAAIPEAALVLAAPLHAVSLAPARVREGFSPPDEPPKVVAELLPGLPQWQVRLVLSLLERGGITALACRTVNVSRESVAKAQRGSLPFAKACAAAVEHSADLPDSIAFRSLAPFGVEPQHEHGLLVGYRVLRPKIDPKSMAQIRERLNLTEEPTRTGGGKVEIVAPEAIPAIVAEVAARLFAARASHRSSALPSG